MVDYLGTIKVYAIEGGIHSKLNEYKDIHVPDVKVILWPLSKVNNISLISNSFCPKATGHTEVNLHIELSWDKGTENYRNNWGHMTKMAAMSIYGKTP